MEECLYKELDKDNATKPFYSKKINSQNVINLENILKLSSKVSKVCSVLEQFGMRFFSYSRIDQNSNLLYLCNNQNYLRNKFQYNIYDGYPKVIEKVQGGIFKYILSGNVPSHNDTLKNLYMHGFWNSFDVYKIQGKYLEIFHFGGSKKSLDLINFYINDEKTFENFLVYFKAQFSEILYKSSPVININTKINLDSFINVATITKYKEALNQLNFSKVYLHNGDMFVRLSKREWETTILYLQGYSAKETADKLNISSRTVQQYIVNAKQKLNLYSKSNLRKVFFSPAI
jgi:hypothetical protein